MNIPLEFDEIKSTRLLELWKAGNQDALNALFARHGAWITERVRRELGDRLRQKMESSDVVQDALLRFMKHGPQIHVDNEKRFRALMSRIVINVICDQSDYWTARRRDLAQEHSLDAGAIVYVDGRSEAREPSEQLRSAETHAQVRLALELLSPIHREVYLRFAFDKWSHKQIADQLGKTESAAQQLYARAASKFAQAFESIRGKDVDALLSELQSEGEQAE